MTVLQLQEARNAAWKAYKELRVKRDANSGKFDDPLDEANFQRAGTEYDSYAERIITAQQEEARDKARLKEEHADQEIVERAKAGEKIDETRMSYENVYKRWLTRNRDSRLPEEDMRVLETRGTSTQITSTNSLGGFLVPQSFSNELENMGLWSGGMMDACRIYSDEIGGTLRWPTGDDTANTGEIIAQGSTKTVIDTSFGNVLFADYLIDSGIIKVSRELVQDERVGLLQSVLAENIANRINRKVNTVLTNGTGTSEPYGLTVASTTIGLTTAGATAITKSELTRMLYSVDKYYSVGAKVGWMMHRQTLGYLRTLDFSTDTTHIFSDLKIAGEPDMLLGYPVFINNDLPALTNNLPVTATKHIYFGDFSKYVIRKISDVSIERNDSAYWTALTVGFMGWTRLDGNLLNQNAIKALRQA